MALTSRRLCARQVNSQDDIISRLKYIFQISREAKREKVKTKEEQQEEKRIAMSIRIKSMDLDGRDINFLISLKIILFFSP